MAKSGTSKRQRPPAPPPPKSALSTGRVIGGLVGLVVIAAVVAIVLQSSKDDSPERAPSSLAQTQPITVDGSLPQFTDTEGDPAIGTASPTIEGKSFDGTTENVKAGKPTMLVFAAHWCPHCQAEIPRIVDWMAAGKAKGVDVVLIATGTNSSAPNYPPSSWLEDEGWTGRIIADDENATAAGAFGLSSYPYMVFIDAEGKVVWRLAGEQTPAALDDALARIT